MAKEQKQSTAVMVLDRLPDSRLPVAPAMLERMLVYQPDGTERGISMEEWQVLTDQTFPSARTAAAVHMALNYCRARRLDIFKRPVHIVPMWSSVLNRMVETIWPGISELRTTAARTGEYAGISETEYGKTIKRKFEMKFEDERSGNSRTVPYEVEYPEWCALKVYRIVHGEARAYHAKVFWTEAYATADRFTDCPNQMWRKRPFGQIEKCTEAAALRRAFPTEIGNDLASEEVAGKIIDHDNEEQVSRIVVEDGEAGGEQKARPQRRVAPKPPDPKLKQQATQEPAGEQQRGDGERNWNLTDADAEFLESLRDRLGEANTEAEAKQTYKELDPEAFFTNDEDSQKVCQSILEFRLKVIARNSKEQ